MLSDREYPQSLKSMSFAEMNRLAEEIRAELVETVTENGGHLASNLGMVELTIALHYVFDSPKDRIVFDVGHQAYVHKLLTGRAKQFGTLRQKDGLCGFPSMAESRHDAFTAGHASTAISAALGLARARDLKKDDYNVIAVVGDGALTGGMCYEAMNDAGENPTRLIVVLNDNEMSISRNVGAVSEHLARLRQSSSYLNAKSRMRRSLEKIPVIGLPVLHLLEKCRDLLKTLLVGERLFETLGFSYSGPVDGHDIKALVRALRIAGEAQRPVVVHVVTQKGRGYKPAEENPAAYHGLPPRNVPIPKREMVASGKTVSCFLQERTAFDKRVCAVVAAMKKGTSLEDFFAKYPENGFDVGIAEDHAVEFAAGLAAGGLKPYVAIYSTFLQRALDQIQTDVCLPKLPVVLLLDRAGLSGEDGATHQGVFDCTYLRVMPNMVLCAPSNDAELRRALELSADTEGPFAIRYPKQLPAESRNESDTRFRIGEGCIVRDGTQAFILALGSTVAEAEDAADNLRTKGISCGVADMRFVKPIDEGLLDELSSRGIPLFTCEENSTCGGFGAAVLEYCAKNQRKSPVIPMGVPDRFISHMTVAQQHAECGLDADTIAKQILKYVSGEKEM